MPPTTVLLNLPVWKTIRINTDLKNAADFRKALNRDELPRQQVGKRDARQVTILGI